MQDVSIVRKSLLPSGLALYAVADGHNGSQAAKAVSSLLEGELLRQLGGSVDPQPQTVRAALARTFLAINDAVCSKYLQSGVGSWGLLGTCCQRVWDGYCWAPGWGHQAA